MTGGGGGGGGRGGGSSAAGLVSVAMVSQGIRLCESVQPHTHRAYSIVSHTASYNTDLCQRLPHSLIEDLGCYDVIIQSRVVTSRETTTNYQ